MTNKLYNECRLYNAPARLLALDLCDRIDSWIDGGALPGFEHCFLPFRDAINSSTEEGIFLEDVDIIDKCAGVVGFFDGSSYDSGCAFEIGYGFAKGLKNNIITTDFLKWSSGASSEFYPISKLAGYLANVVAISDPDPSIANYRKRQTEILERAIEALRQNLISDFGVGAAPKRALEQAPALYDYYLDPNFWHTEYGALLGDDIINAIKRAGKTFVVGDVAGDISAGIDNLRQSAQAVLYSDAYEPNVDSGFLQGLAYGIGRKPLIYCSNKTRYQSSIATNYLNAMIQYSAKAVCHSRAELETYIKEA